MFTSEGTFADVNGDPINATLLLGVANLTRHRQRGHHHRHDRDPAAVAVGRCEMGPVARVESLTMSPDARTGRDAGFSLIELMVAMSILMVGLLGLAQVFYFGLAIVSTSSAQLIAREKAREAIESVHTARDTRVITWAQIRNVGAPDCSPWPTTTANGGGTFTTGGSAAARRRPGRPGRDRR